MTERRVLLAVDEDRGVLRAMSLVFHREWQVVTATSAADALGLVALGLVPDAIVVELDLPHMDGLALVLALPAWLQERVVFTSHHASWRRADALAKTRALVLSKPMNLDTLERAIDDTVAGRQRADRLVA